MRKNATTGPAKWDLSNRENSAVYQYLDNLYIGILTDRERWVSEWVRWVSEWSEWERERVREKWRVSEWVSECSEWVREWVSEWVSERERERERDEERERRERERRERRERERGERGEERLRERERVSEWERSVADAMIDTVVRFFQSFSIKSSAIMIMQSISSNIKPFANRSDGH